MKEFENLVQKAIEFINVCKLAEAEECLKSAMTKDTSAPQVYNLYGILNEYKGDYLLALKFYRASYAFDPTYKPAIRNLERVTGSENTSKKSGMDLGEQNEENEQENDYLIKYDEYKYRQIKKKSC